MCLDPFSHNYKNFYCYSHNLTLIPGAKQTPVLSLFLIHTCMYTTTTHPHDTYTHKNLLRLLNPHKGFVEHRVPQVCDSF